MREIELVVKKDIEGKIREAREKIGKAYQTIGEQPAVC